MVLPDELVLNTPGCLAQMIEAAGKLARSHHQHRHQQHAGEGSRRDPGDDPEDRAERAVEARRPGDRRAEVAVLAGGGEACPGSVLLAAIVSSSDDAIVSKTALSSSASRSWGARWSPLRRYPQRNNSRTRQDKDREDTADTTQDKTN